MTISRQIARLLSGEIQVDSTPGQGSTFTLYLPLAYQQGTPLPKVHKPVAVGKLDLVYANTTYSEARLPRSARARLEITDDRGSIQPGDRVLLLIEDDPAFASVLLDLAHERSFKCVVALLGQEGLTLARDLQPDAITLDIRLPDTPGWAVLDRLKHDPRTRHIPVHVISVDKDRHRGLAMGAVTYLVKSPSKEALVEAFAKIQTSVERRTRELLVVEGDEDQRKEMLRLVENTDVTTTFLRTGEEALAALGAKQFDCVVLDPELPDIAAPQLIERIRQMGQNDLPIIIYNGENLKPEDAAALEKLAHESIVLEARSPEQLLEETSLFLHRVEADMPEAERRLLQQARQDDTGLAAAKILIVDDDVRNLFALTSVLERQNVRVFPVESGRAGIELLKNTPGVDLVIMDIMMPEMDGYQTMREIRKDPQFGALPILALTAKAMKGDREKCLEAGASDYIPKPVEVEELLLLLRAWLPQTRTARQEQVLTESQG